MILEIDQGNSRCKWRLRQGQQHLQAGSGDTSTGDYNQLFAELRQPPAAVHVATVVPSRNPALEHWCQQQWQLTPVYAQVTRVCGGVRNGYEDLQQMGVDRWLAMVAAYQLVASACVVVSAGTACTVDLVTANGLHRGGFIGPGLQMMNNALFRNTDQVKVPALIDSEGLIPGTSTAAAVSAGLRAMQLGLVLRGIRQLLIEADQPWLVITGGGGQGLASLVTDSLVAEGVSHIVAGVRVVPELVLDGLLWGC